VSALVQVACRLDLVREDPREGVRSLNVGPKPDGAIPDEARQILLGLGRWLGVNGAGRNFWNGLYPSEIVSVSMLGDGRPLKWEMTKEGMTIETPPTRPCAYACVFKIVRRPPF
jgi:alpha-L-fucosidase